MTDLRLPEITEQAALEALQRLGMDPCQIHAPEDPQERISGYLGAILALAQVHITSRQRHRETIVDSYHTTRGQFHPQPECGCGEDHD